MHAFINIHLPLLLTLPISLLLPLCNNTHQSITFQNRKSPSWTLQSSVITTHIPAIMGAVPTSCQQVTRRDRQRGGTAWDRVLVISGCFCPAERWRGGYLCRRTWTSMHAYCEAVWNVSWGIKESCLSFCQHMINHYTWNPFTAVESGQ